MVRILVGLMWKLSDGSEDYLLQATALCLWRVGCSLVPPFVAHVLTVSGSPGPICGSVL